MFFILWPGLHYSPWMVDGVIDI